MDKKAKVIYVLVEGPSDRHALTRILIESFQGFIIEFDMVKDDITTKIDKPGKIPGAVRKRLEEFCIQAGYKVEDIAGILHVTDTDGSFAPDGAIMHDSKQRQIFYNPDTQTLLTDKTDHTKRRNYRKRRNINALVEFPYLEFRNLRDIPYRIVYMSCNLDHVISGNPNERPDYKVREAKEFAKRYKGKLQDALSFFTEVSGETPAGYLESWDYMRGADGPHHSLDRGTNIQTVLEDNTWPS